MRKMAVVLALGTALLCAGCSGGNSTAGGGSDGGSGSGVVDGTAGSGAADGGSESNAADGASVGGNSDEGSNEASVSLADMLPDASAIFEEATFNVISDGAKLYCFTVDGYEDGDYEKYVDECKKTFTDVKFDIYTDSNNKFEAKTEDGKYYVSVQLIFEQQSFTVTCGVSGS